MIKLIISFTMLFSLNLLAENSDNKLQQHTIEKGDTLISISSKYLKNPQCWKQIQEINKTRIKGFNKLKVGQTILIPPKKQCPEEIVLMLGSTFKKIAKEANIETEIKKAKVVKKPAKTLTKFYYTIQIAAYEMKEIAVSHKKNLEKLGYTINIVQVDLGTKGQWFRIHVGKFASYAQAFQFALKNSHLFPEYFILKIVSNH